eukprot:473618-Rhodomonas_salina.1
MRSKGRGFSSVYSSGNVWPGSAVTNREGLHRLLVLRVHGPRQMNHACALEQHACVQCSASRVHGVRR